MTAAAMIKSMHNIRTLGNVRRYSQEWLSLDTVSRGKIEMHQIEAPVKVSRICAEFDLPITRAPLPARISGEIRPSNASPSRYIVKINRFESATRQRFTAAHELSHFLLHQEYIGEGIVDNVLFRSNVSTKIEAEANRLSADILMPFHLIKFYVDEFCNGKISNVDLNEASDYFKVSKMALSFRLGI